MKGSTAKASSVTVKFPALSPPSLTHRAKSLCLPHLQPSPDSSPYVHQANKRYSFRLAAETALALMASAPQPKVDLRKRLEPLPNAKFLPQTQCYLERKPSKLHLRFSHMNRTLDRIPCHDFITALLSGEPFAEDVLRDNLRKCGKRCEEVPAVVEEDDETAVLEYNDN